MGVQSELIDRRNQRRFCLDKGSWPRADLDEGPRTLAQVRAGIVSALDNRYGAGTTSQAQVDALAPRLWAFCEVAAWDVEWYCDAGDYSDDAMASWPVVDCRLRHCVDNDPCAAATATKLKEATACQGG